MLNLVVGLRGLAIAAAIAFALGGTLGGMAGWKITDAWFGAALARKELAEEQAAHAATQRDLEAAQLALKAAAAAAEEIEARDRARQATVKEGDHGQAQSGDGLVDDVGADWMRRISPD